MAMRRRKMGIKVKRNTQLHGSSMFQWNCTFAPFLARVQLRPCYMSLRGGSRAHRVWHTRWSWIHNIFFSFFFFFYRFSNTLRKIMEKTPEYEYERCETYINDRHMTQGTWSNEKASFVQWTWGTWEARKMTALCQSSKNTNDGNQRTNERRKK